jgi:hypothetical protein
MIDEVRHDVDPEIRGGEIAGEVLREPSGTTSHIDDEMRWKKTVLYQERAQDFADRIEMPADRRTHRMFVSMLALQALDEIGITERRHGAARIAERATRLRGESPARTRVA